MRTTPLLCVCFLAAALFHPVASPAQSVDPHLTANGGHALFRLSSFAHGYIHGYEDGFHFGNIDVQLAHARRDPGRVMSAAKAHPPYRREFGDKKFFSEGYRRGFHAGYNDVLDQRAFRAFDLITTASAGLDSAALPATEFDSGFMAGAEAAEHLRTKPAEANAADASTTRCPARKTSDAYCEAYARGYRFGLAETSGADNLSTAARLNH